MLDDVDRRILRHWLAEPSLAGSDLAERAGVTPAVLSRRVDRLKRDGVVKAVRTRINWQALGYAVEVSLRITLDKTVAEAFNQFTEAARDIPEVIEIQTFLGRVDIRLLVLARDMAHYQELYRARILTLPHIADIEALMNVATVKTAQGLPV